MCQRVAKGVDEETVVFSWWGEVGKVSAVVEAGEVGVVVEAGDVGAVVKAGEISVVVEVGDVGAVVEAGDVGVVECISGNLFANLSIGKFASANA